MDLKKIAGNQLKNVVSGQTSTMEELWKNDRCVIIFLRRWGCMFCRLWAKEVSEIAPILKKHNVKLIGIGVEELGFEEFRDGNYFDGDLYINSDKDTYASLGFKRFNFLSVMASLLWKESRDAISKGRSLGVGGNTKGDGLQNGGALIMEKGGSILKHFIQNGPAEHLSNNAILEALNLVDEIKGFPQPETVTSEGECKRI